MSKGLFIAICGKGGGKSDAQRVANAVSQAADLSQYTVHLVYGGDATYKF